jgi:hypothetical protein
VKNSSSVRWRQSRQADRKCHERVVIFLQVAVAFAVTADNKKDTRRPKRREVPVLVVGLRNTSMIVWSTLTERICSSEMVTEAMTNLALGSLSSS